MSSAFEPKKIIDLEQIIGDALAQQTPLEILGAGSKRAVGQPMVTAQQVSLVSFSGITLYEPEELVLAARAGTPLMEIEKALDQFGQQLAFEPVNLGNMLGNKLAQTIGGVMATNFSGPRRIQAGAARDHLLGVEMVTGRGERIKTGGRVVKNVTGYDLCKLFVGSYGTLAVATNLTFKVLPASEKTRTILVTVEGEEAAVSAMKDSLNSPNNVSGAAFLSKEFIKRSKVSYVSSANASITAIRIEGSAPSVEARCCALKKLLIVYGDIQELHYHNSMQFWREVGNVTPYVDKVGVVWRISAAPTNAIEIVRKISNTLAIEFYLDWGGGLIWLRVLEKRHDGGALEIRDAIKAHGGHATLIRANEKIRSQVPVFQPQAVGVTALSQRIKGSFDPTGILNPGRMAYSPGADHAN